jgi:hypothetical protein
METIIVSIPVHYTNARKVCNDIQEQVFESYTDLRDYLKLHLNVEDEDHPQFFSLNDFMEECNDELFNFQGTFISYVKIKKQ